MATVANLVILYAWIGGSRLKELTYWYIYLIITLPLSTLVNLAIKRPIGLALFSVFNISELPKFWPLWFLPIANLIAPLTEETIKILPVILSEVRNSIREKRKALNFGLLLGFGFGIGEVWYLAISFTLAKPEYASGHFLDLIGFFIERCGAVIIHGLLTAIVLSGFKQNFTKYFFIAAGFHYLINVGPALYQKGTLSLWATSIPLLLSVLALFKYAFKIEQQLRKENSAIIEKEILWMKK